MSNNLRAESKIQERIIQEIQDRLDTYYKYASGTTAEDLGRAVAARTKIAEWAISDLSLLLTERKRLIEEVRNWRDGFIICKLTDAEDMVERLQKEVASLKSYAEQVSSRHSCNDCGMMKGCFYKPEWGDVVRHNCIFWDPIQPKTVD